MTLKLKRGFLCSGVPFSAAMNDIAVLDYKSLKKYARTSALVFKPLTYVRVIFTGKNQKYYSKLL